MATKARQQLERHGIELDDLVACEDLGPDGTRLPRCVKTYLGPGTGRGPGHWGMVFREGESDDDGTVLLQFLAFGVRHQPSRGRAPTVYWLADRRLHDRN